MSAPMDARLNTVQLSERWGVSAGTLEQWRGKGKGPAFIKIGTRRAAAVFYSLADILEYERKHTVRPKK